MADHKTHVADKPVIRYEAWCDNCPWTFEDSSEEVAREAARQHEGDHRTTVEESEEILSRWVKGERRLAGPQRPSLKGDHPLRGLVRGAGPCPCACNSGGFCGGCGHAGCGGRNG